jgi:hypothetical protein
LEAAGRRARNPSSSSPFPHLARIDHRPQRLQLLLERHRLPHVALVERARAKEGDVAVGPVDLEEVDRVDAHPRERPVHRADHVLLGHAGGAEVGAQVVDAVAGDLGEGRGVGVGSRRRARAQRRPLPASFHLGRQHHFVPRPGVALEEGPHYALRVAGDLFLGRHGVDLRRVPKRDAALQRVRHLLVPLGLGVLHAPRHGAQAASCRRRGREACRGEPTAAPPPQSPPDAGRAINRHQPAPLLTHTRPSGRTAPTAADWTRQGRARRRRPRPPRGGRGGGREVRDGRWGGRRASERSGDWVLARGPARRRAPFPVRSPQSQRAVPTTNARPH